MLIAELVSGNHNVFPLFRSGEENMRIISCSVSVQQAAYLRPGFHSSSVQSQQAWLTFLLGQPDPCVTLVSQF